MENKTDNYIPYGDEWVKEIKKLPKDFIIDMLKKALTEKSSQPSVSEDPSTEQSTANLSKIKDKDKWLDDVRGVEKSVVLPTDKETQSWYVENIDMDCSPSSAIYKFRLWLRDRNQSPTVQTGPQRWVNIYNGEGDRFISDEDYSSFQEAYDGRDKLSGYVETACLTHPSLTTLKAEEGRGSK